MADEFFVGEDLVAYYEIENDILFLKVLMILPPATTMYEMENMVSSEISNLDDRRFSTLSYLNI